MICTATIIGNLVRDPESKTVVTKDGEQTVTRFSLAVNHGFDKDAPVSYFDFVAWNGLGTSLAQFKKQGDQIAVVAEPRQSRWEKDGEKRNKVEFTARTIEYLRSKGDGGSRANTNDVPDEVVAAAAPAPVEAAPVVEVAQTEIATEPAPVPF